MWGKAFCSEAKKCYLHSTFFLISQIIYYRLIMEEPLEYKRHNRNARKTRFLLLIDSDPGNLFYLSMILQRMDYQISTAVNTEEAMTIANIIAPSLIITALDLESKSGIELIHQLKQNSSLARVPIIGICKRNDKKGEKVFRELGVASCLIQPISAEDLFRAVQEAIENNPRSSIRIKAILPIKINGIPINSISGLSSVEISERGMFLHTTKPTPVDTTITLQIELNNKVINTEATVLYNSRTLGNSYHVPGMGLEFTRISRQDTEVIRQYIRDELAGDIKPSNR